MSDFAPLDARSRVLEDYCFTMDDKQAPVSDLAKTGHVKNAAVSDLAKTLVTDSYCNGSPQMVRRMAWDAYNSRPGLELNKIQMPPPIRLVELEGSIRSCCRLATLARHPMHVVLDLPNNAQCWLGGIAASGSTEVLVKNGIGAILAAASHPFVVRDSRVEFLGNFDGTGVACGDIDKKLVVGVFDRMLKLLSQGQKVLTSCKCLGRFRTYNISKSSHNSRRIPHLIHIQLQESR